MIDLKRNIHFSSSVMDLSVMTLIGGIFTVPDIAYHMIYYDPAIHGVPPTPLALFGLMNMGFCLLYCKDCIAGQSLGKRQYKLKVIRLKTGQAASPIRCLIRNLSLVLLPIEVVMILVYPSRRIGDLIAGTKLVPTDDTNIGGRLNYPQIALSVVISYFFVLFSYTWWFCR